MNFATKKLTGVRTMTIRCDPHVFGKHEDQSSDDGDDTGKQLCKSKEQTIGKNIGICNDTADDITGAVAVQVGERKYLDMADRFCTDILYCTEGHTVVDDVHDPGSNTGKMMTITRIRLKDSTTSSEVYLCSATT